MSRWSDELPARCRSPGRRSKTDGASDRGHVEPLAALAAVFAVAVALTTYAGVLDATLPTPDRNLAEPTVERVERAVAETGVVDPGALPAGVRAGPDDHHVNLTLDAAGRTWRTGPTPPARGDVADLAVSVRVGPGQVRPGELRAEVWT